MGQTDKSEHSSDLAEHDAKREAQQPYASEMQDREEENNRKAPEASKSQSEPAKKRQR